MYFCSNRVVRPSTGCAIFPSSPLCRCSTLSQHLHYHCICTVLRRPRTLVTLVDPSQHAGRHDHPARAHRSRMCLCRATIRSLTDPGCHAPRDAGIARARRFPVVRSTLNFSHRHGLSLFNSPPEKPHPSCRKSRKDGSRMAAGKAVPRCHRT